MKGIWDFLRPSMLEWCTALLRAVANTERKNRSERKISNGCKSRQWYRAKEQKKNGSSFSLSNCKVTFKFLRVRDKVELKDDVEN